MRVAQNRDAMKESITMDAFCVLQTPFENSYQYLHQAENNKDYKGPFK